MTAAGRLRRILAASLVLAAAAVQDAAAASVRVDDSGTVVSAPVVQMRWRQLVPGRASDHTVEAQLRVALRLNLAAWVNQPVRLYMVLAPVAGQAVEASWRTQGRLLPGKIRSGTRALVFDGRVAAPLLEETIEMTLGADGRELTGTHALQFSFELDSP